MEFRTGQQLTFGELVSGAFVRLVDNWLAVLCYLVAISLATWLESAVPVEFDGLASLVWAVVFFGGNYLVVEAMLRRAGQGQVGSRRRYFRFAALGILTFLGTLIATYVVILPGLIVGSRLLMSPCYLVGTDRGVWASIHESWTATRGNTFSIALVLVVLTFGSLVAVGAMGLGGAAFLVPITALSVTVFVKLNDDSRELEAVFA